MLCLSLLSVTGTDYAVSVSTVRYGYRLSCICLYCPLRVQVTLRLSLMYATGTAYTRNLFLYCALQVWVTLRYRRVITWTGLTERTTTALPPGRNVNRFILHGWAQRAPSGVNPPGLRGAKGEGLFSRISSHPYNFSLSPDTTIPRSAAANSAAVQVRFTVT